MSVRQKSLSVRIITASASLGFVMETMIVMTIVMRKTATAAALPVSKVCVFYSTVSP